MIDSDALPRRAVGGVAFSVIPLQKAIEIVIQLGSRQPNKGSAVHFANAYNVAIADSDASYAALLTAGEFVFTDGLPVAWVGRLLHRDVAARWSRVYGPDVLTGVLEGSAGTGVRHYFLGGTPQTLDLLINQVRSRWPGAVIAGHESPPFRPATANEIEERDARIQASGASLVWVGLGTPKQDYEVRRLVDSLPVTALAVGAAFDFVAGTKVQAPKWIRQAGMEWAFRLATEPRRLARRYAWGNPRFLYAVLTHAGRV